MAVRSPDQRRLRALEIIKRKVFQNQTIETIAKEMNISHDTVERDILFARKAHLLRKFEDQMVNKLFPMAFGRVMREMEKEDGDLKTAKDILFSIGVMHKGTSRPVSQSAQEDEETLAAWVSAARITDLREANAEANTLEGELVAGSGIGDGELDRINGYLESGLEAGGGDGDPEQAAVAAPDPESREG